MLSDGGKHGRRFIEHEQSRVRISAFAISTRCCAATESSSTRAEGRARSPYVRRARAARDRLLQVQHAVTAEGDVLGDGHHRHEREMLVNHADAEGDRVPDYPAGPRAAHLDGAGIGCSMP